jgi:two-component system, LuxR family, response regulator FixJ
MMPAPPESICILDDDNSVLRSVAQLLYSEGLKATSFDRAENMLAHARTHVVLVAVLDVWMPDMSGLEVQANLNKISPSTKVIVMTGRETPAIRAAALEAGAFAFVQKPLNDEAFLFLVHQALGSGT